MQATGRDLSKINCLTTTSSATIRTTAPTSRQSIAKIGDADRRRRQLLHKQRGGHQPDQPKPGGQQQQRGEGQMWCSYNKTTTHSDADCHTRPTNRPNGNAHNAQVRPPSVSGVCSSWDLSGRDDFYETFCISFFGERGPACEQALQSPSKGEGGPVIRPSFDSSAGGVENLPLVIYSAC